MYHRHLRISSNIYLIAVFIVVFFTIQQKILHALYAINSSFVYAIVVQRSTHIIVRVCSTVGYEFPLYAASAGVSDDYTIIISLFQ